MLFHLKAISCKQNIARFFKLFNQSVFLFLKKSIFNLSTFNTTVIILGLIPAILFHLFSLPWLCPYFFFLLVYCCADTLFFVPLNFRLAISKWSSFFYFDTWYFYIFNKSILKIIVFWLQNMWQEGREEENYCLEWVTLPTLSVCSVLCHHNTPKAEEVICPTNVKWKPKLWKVFSCQSYTANEQQVSFQSNVLGPHSPSQSLDHCLPMEIQCKPHILFHISLWSRLKK